MSLPRAADGRWGARLRVPPRWTLLEDEEGRVSWDAGGLALSLERWREPVFVDAFLLRDFRQDLRLLSAQRGGGLVACELRPGLSGVWGLSKEPQRRGGEGSTYRAQLLIPTASGTLCLGALAHEEAPFGGREAELQAQARAAEGPGRVRPNADPYGYAYDSESPDDEFPYWSYPEALRLASEADRADYDLLFADHALSRVRSLLNEVDLEVCDPSPLRVPRGRVAVGSALFFRPLGFVASGPTQRGEGRRFMRISFGGQRSELVVAHHPAPPGAELREAARALWERAPRVEAGAELRVREQVLGRHSAVLLEHQGPERYGLSCVVAWEDHLLEVHRGGPACDWRRANADLLSVVQSLGGLESPPRPSEAAADVTPGGRRRVFRVLCWLASSDDDVDPSEARLLESLRHEFQITPDEAHSLAADAASGGQIPLGRRAAERDLLVRHLVRIVAADGIFDPGEARRLAKLAPRLGVDSAALIRLVQDELE